MKASIFHFRIYGRKVRLVGENFHEDEVFGDYIIVKALEDGVTLIGLTRGKDTRFHHTEKLDKGEVMLVQFTKTTSAMKIRGRAEILTKHGALTSGKD
jgi:transcription attenuation protein (tryptophan RNA-binding attenuator protein)